VEGKGKQHLKKELSAWGGRRSSRSSPSGSLPKTDGSMEGRTELFRRDAGVKRDRGVNGKRGKKHQIRRRGTGRGDDENRKSDKAVSDRSGAEKDRLSKEKRKVKPSTRETRELGLKNDDTWWAAGRAGVGARSSAKGPK